MPCEPWNSNTPLVPAQEYTWLPCFQFGMFFLWLLVSFFPRPGRILTTVNCSSDWWADWVSIRIGALCEVYFYPFFPLNSDLNKLLYNYNRGKFSLLCLLISGLDLPFMMMPHPLLPVSLPPASVAMAMNQMNHLNTIANMAAAAQMHSPLSRAGASVIKVTPTYSQTVYSYTHPQDGQCSVDP